MSSLATLQTEMAKFMVPTGPTGTEDPPGFTPGDGGWPDKPPMALPSAITGVTPSASPNNTTITAVGLSPDTLVGGYATLSKDANIPGGSPEPSGFFGEGIKILSNTATSVTLEKPLDDGTGIHTKVVAASSNNQVLFDVDDSNIALVLSVKRLAPATDGAVDPSVPGHNLDTGQIGIGAMSPAIQTGHQVEFKYRRKLAGGHAAGLGYSLVPSRSPPGGSPPPLTVGQAWSEAYGAFFGTASPAPTPGTYAVAIQAMRSVMDSLSAIPGMGAVSFTAGLVAFWSAIAANATVVFSGVPSTITVVPPPGIFTVGPAIAAAMAPTIPIPPPAPGPGWTPTRALADVAIMATVIMSSSQGGQVIAQPGPAPVPTPIIFA